MKHRRSFAVELKRQIVEELLSGMSKPAQLTRRYEISSGLLYHWKEQYAKGRFDNDPGKETSLEDCAPTGTTGRQTDLGERVFKKSRSEGPFDATEEKRQFLIENRHLLKNTERVNSADTILNY